jgi:hypothetical protein
MEESVVRVTNCEGKATLYRAAFLALIAVGVFSGLACAQTPAAPPPEREGSAEFAFVGTTGNSSTQTIGLGGEFIYRPSPWESKFRVSYVRNEAEDQLRAQAFVLTLRAGRPIQDRLSGYAQYGYQRDRFAGILNRNTIEAGLRTRGSTRHPTNWSWTADWATPMKTGLWGTICRLPRWVRVASTR